MHFVSGLPRHQVSWMGPASKCIALAICHRCHRRKLTCTHQLSPMSSTVDTCTRCRSESSFLRLSVLWSEQEKDLTVICTKPFALVSVLFLSFQAPLTNAIFYLFYFSFNKSIYREGGKCGNRNISSGGVKKGVCRIMCWEWF